MIWSWAIRILQCIFDILQLYSTHVRWLTKSITINSKSVSINCFISVFFKCIKDKIVNDCIGPGGNHSIRSWVSLQARQRNWPKFRNESRGEKSCWYGWIQLSRAFIYNSFNWRVYSGVIMLVVFLRKTPLAFKLYRTLSMGTCFSDL